MYKFMPSAQIEEVPGIGTFGVYGVANGHGSQGVQVQFVPEGGSERLPGHMSFKVRLVGERDFEIFNAEDGDNLRNLDVHHVLKVGDHVFEAAWKLADKYIRSSDTNILFNLISVGQQEVKDINEQLDLLKRRAHYYSCQFDKQQLALANGSNCEIDYTADGVSFRNKILSDYQETYDVRIVALKQLLSDLRGWSCGAPDGEKRPSIMELLADRDENNVDHYASHYKGTW